MSAGAFLKSFYESDDGLKYGIRCQPESAALVIAGTTNALPAGPADAPVSARLRGNRRSIGMHARYIRLRWTGGAPTGYLSGQTFTVPVFQKSIFDDYTAVPGLTGTYLGEGVAVISGTNEKKR